MWIALLYIYTILAYTILYPFTIFHVLLILALNTLGAKKAIPFLIRSWAKWSFILVGKKFRIEGRENLSKEQKYILVANHSSMFDVMGIMSICPNVSFFGKAYLMEIPVFGKLLKVINFIPMKRTDLKNAKYMIEQLIKRSENQTIAIFPEGTRTTNGEMSNFRRGFLHVLKASKLDILPVSLVGFYGFNPKTKFYFNYSKKLKAVIHAPITFSELENLDDKEIIKKVQTKIESALSSNTYKNNSYTDGNKSI